MHPPEMKTDHPLRAVSQPWTQKIWDYIIPRTVYNYFYLRGFQK